MRKKFKRNPIDTEKFYWLEFIGKEIGEARKRGQSHFDAIKTAHSEARKAYRRKHPELHVVPDYLKEPDTFQRLKKNPKKRGKEIEVIAGKYSATFKDRVTALKYARAVANTHKIQVKVSGT